MCAHVCECVLCVRECVWMTQFIWNTSQELWTVKFNFSKFPIGTKKEEKVTALNVVTLRAPGQKIQKSKSGLCVAVGRCTEWVFFERFSRFLLIVRDAQPNHPLRTFLERCLCIRMGNRGILEVVSVQYPSYLQSFVP